MQKKKNIGAPVRMTSFVAVACAAASGGSTWVATKATRSRHRTISRSSSDDARYVFIQRNP